MRDRKMPCTLRSAEAADAAFLAEMLVAAAYWHPGAPPGSVEDVLAEPGLAHYVHAWPRAGDLGVVAEHGAEPLGAAWLRYFTADDPGYGFVAPDTPELSVGVIVAARSRGVGTRLLGALLGAARKAGHTAVSLSVEPDNPALRLYGRTGFVAVGENGGSTTMLLRLCDPVRSTPRFRAS